MKHIAIIIESYFHNKYLHYDNFSLVLSKLLELWRRFNFRMMLLQHENTTTIQHFNISISEGEGREALLPSSEAWNSIWDGLCRFGVSAIGLEWWGEPCR